MGKKEIGRKKGKRNEKRTERGGGARQYERQALVHTDTQSCPGGTMLPGSYLGPKEGSVS